MSSDRLLDFLSQGVEFLRQEDPHLYDLLNLEHQRQKHVLTMVAASSIADPSVFACMGTVIGNLTTEGYPNKRFHAGCEVADEIETLAINRAKNVFKAKYANLQPHSGTTANQIVLFSILKPGDTVMGLGLNAGGHLTHGSRASVVGQYFNCIEYGVDENGFIDYNKVSELACTVKPALIIAGASSYPRIIDFRKFRDIADEVGAFLLADISHIAGLVAAGEHPSPIDCAHFTTTSTYKQLYGPRGGMILIGKDYETLAPDGKTTLAELIQKATFPFFQGTPNLNAIAAKARSLAFVATPGFKDLAIRIITNAKYVARFLSEKGYHVLTGGTDNHLILIDMIAKGITGVIAEKSLEECNIIVNRNRIPGDSKPALVASGLRLGTNSLAFRKMGIREMKACADMLDEVFSSLHVVNDRHYILEEYLKKKIQLEVEELCQHFPMPHYSE